MLTKTIPGAESTLRCGRSWTRFVFAKSLKNTGEDDRSRIWYLFAGRPFQDLVSFREADTYLPVRPFQSSKSLKNTGEDDRSRIWYLFARQAVPGFGIFS